jgi:hypothetical protein
VLLVHAAALVGQHDGLEPAEVEPAVVEGPVEPERAIGEVRVQQRAEGVEPAGVPAQVDDEVPDLRACSSAARRPKSCSRSNSPSRVV